MCLTHLIKNNLMVKDIKTKKFLINSIFYSGVIEKSQIQVKKKEPVLHGETSILKEPDMITLADKENEVKPIDKKEENKNKEMEAEKKTDWIMPVNGRISSEYGYRLAPTKGASWNSKI